MPHFTPSRLAVVVLTLSLLTFLWTYGLPNPVTSPSSNQDGGGGRAPQSPGMGDKGKEDNLEVPEFDFDRFGPEGGKEREKSSSSASIMVTPTSTATLIDVSGPVKTPTLTPTPTSEPSAKPEKEEKPKEEVKPGQDGQTTAPGESLKEQKGNTSETAAKADSTSSPTAALQAGNGTGTAKATSTPSATMGPDFCKHVHRASDVMIIIKTSKAEIKDKLPTHLKTLLSCVPNLVIFSDHEGKIDGIQIHDVLDSVSESAKQKYSEFRDYERIKTEDDVRPGSVNKDLDKWKILPMIYKAYQMRPDHRFYMFIEADTSLSWANLLQWIDRLDYRIAYYSGAPNTMDKIRFAQRGPGILLSQGALRLYAKGYTELYESKWEERIGKGCCGDIVLATAMADSRVEFYPSFPLIQGESPWTLDWTKRHWCAPMLTWHHMNAKDLETIWDRQNNWTAYHGWEKPYLFRDAFTELIEPHLVDVKPDWDNISADSKITKNANADSDPDSEWAKHSDLLKASIESPENCKKVCEVTEDCLQWKHSTKGNGECYAGKIIRYGRKVERREGEEWTSGWMKERIKAKMVEWECKEVKWKFGQ